MAASIPVFASEDTKTLLPPESSIHTETDLSSMDLSKPFSETKQYTDENVTSVIVTVSYTPARQPEGAVRQRLLPEHGFQKPRTA
jgi:hypothetical protein